MPTIGTAAMPSSNIGKNAISAMAMAASEPSSPARGTRRRTALPNGASTILRTPISTSTRQPDVPGELHRLFIVRLAGKELPPLRQRRQEHQKGDAERAWRVEAERHRSDSRLTRASGQAEGHRRVDEIAEQHAESGAGDHARRGRTLS